MTRININKAWAASLTREQFHDHYKGLVAATESDVSKHEMILDELYYKVCTKPMEEVPMTRKEAQESVEEDRLTQGDGDE